MEKKYSISDASRQVEVENHVLRYWEEELGLNIHRNSKGHRFYTDRDIKILRDVKDLKEQGFLLKSIKLIIHDIDNVRKMNPNEQYKLREELNQKIQDEEENNSNKAKTVNGFMISRSQSVQTDNVVQLENKSMSGAAGQVLNIQKGELGQTAFKQGEQRSVAVPSEEKIKRFELMLRKMVANVVEEGQKESEQRISDNVSTKLMKEINYIMMQKDEMAAKQTKLLEEILQKIQSQSLEEVAATSQIKQLKTKEKKKDDGYGRKVLYILNRLGMSGEKGGDDILRICEYLHNNGRPISQVSIGQLCELLSDAPKNMEQRVRRAIAVGMSNLAHLGIEDFMNETFTAYSSTLFPFEEIRAEMDHIRGKRRYGGKVSIKKFIDSLMLAVDREV